MEADKTTYDKIELRSKKVRQLIGEIPPSLVRWGIAIIAIVILFIMLFNMSNLFIDL